MRFRYASHRQTKLPFRPSRIVVDAALLSDPEAKSSARSPQGQSASLRGSFRRPRQIGVGVRPSQVQLAHRQRSQFPSCAARSAPASCRSVPVPDPAVPERAATTGRSLATSLAFRFPRRTVIASSSGRRRATSSNRTQFSFGHRPALRRQLSIGVGLRHTGEGVDDQGEADACERTSCQSPPFLDGYSFRLPADMPRPRV